MYVLLSRGVFVQSDPKHSSNKQSLLQSFKYLSASCSQYETF